MFYYVCFLSIVDIISVDPSKVTITGVPTDLVPEGTSVTVVCTTTEGNPVPTITWVRDSQAVPVDTDLESVTNTQTDGSDYNGKVRLSTLQIQPDRSLDGIQFKCEVEGTTLQESFTLRVACLYFFHEYKIIVLMCFTIALLKHL